MEKVGYAVLSFLVGILFVRAVYRMVPQGAPVQITVVEQKIASEEPLTYVHSPKSGESGAPLGRSMPASEHPRVEGIFHDHSLPRGRDPSVILVTQYSHQRIAPVIPEFRTDRIPPAKSEEQIQEHTRPLSDTSGVTESDESDAGDVFGAIGASTDGGCSGMRLVDDPAARGSANLVRRLATTLDRQGELIDRYANKHGVDCRIVLAVMAVESQGNPRAVSNMGARGLMQIMPGTGKMLGLGRHEFFDPEANLDAGIRYILEGLEGSDHDLARTLAGYECGHGCGRKLRDPTRREYVRSVMAYLAIMGFHL